MAEFKPDETASLLAKRFNLICWIYKNHYVYSLGQQTSCFADLNAPIDF